MNAAGLARQPFYPTAGLIKHGTTLILTQHGRLGPETAFGIRITTTHASTRFQAGAHGLKPLECRPCAVEASVQAGHENVWEGRPESQQAANARPGPADIQEGSGSQSQPDLSSTSRGPAAVRGASEAAQVGGWEGLEGSVEAGRQSQPMGRGRRSRQGRQRRAPAGVLGTQTPGWENQGAKDEPEAGTWLEEEAKEVTGRRTGEADGANIEEGSTGNPPAEDGEEQPDDADLVEIGVLGAPFGVKGQIRVKAITDSPEQRLGVPGLRFIQEVPGGLAKGRSPTPPRPVQLQSGRKILQKGKDVWLVKLKGIDNPEEAVALNKHRLLIQSWERPPLSDEDEFYVQELVGMQVLRVGSEELVGEVVDLYDGTGTHDVLRIRLASANGQGPTQTALLPFVKQFVPDVDRRSRLMRIAPPEGWIMASDRDTPREARGLPESPRPPAQKKPGPSGSPRDQSDPAELAPPNRSRGRPRRDGLEPSPGLRSRDKSSAPSGRQRKSDAGLPPRTRESSGRDRSEKRAPNEAVGGLPGGRIVEFHRKTASLGEAPQ
eukprot:jgi/Botrbrau1/933/Bobra.0167s0044.1